MNQHISFIGAGNMASSLIGGLIDNGHDAARITACDLNPRQLENLAERFGIGTTQDTAAAAKAAEVVMLAVKPQVMREVCAGLAGLEQNPRQLFISVAAGVGTDALDRWLGGGRALVRCMPNTPALLQLGASGLFAGARVSEQQKQSAQAIMEAVGICLWVDDEADLDAVTAISGSGPAYFFYFIELLEEAGVKLGLARESAARLARQTAFGAASMARNADVRQLRAQVTSNKGTTEQAILSFQQNDLGRLVDEATAAAHRRSLELGRELTEAQV